MHLSLYRIKMGEPIQILIHFVAKSTEGKRLQVQKFSVCYLCLWKTDENSEYENIN
jgi:hypothetical protein